MSRKVKSFKFLFNFTALGILAYHLIHVLLLWPDLPAHIAIHFTNGEPDNYGSKYFILLMPVIGILLWWFMGSLTKHPDKLNYINLTEHNREKQYKMSQKVMTFIRNIILILFIVANESFIRYAVGIENSVLHYLPLSLMAVVMLVVFYHLIWAARLKE